MTPTTPGEVEIAAWSNTPTEAMAAMEPDGDFVKKHLINPTIFRLLSDPTGRRVLDAGAGAGYLSRLLAARGALVTAVEPAGGLYDYGAGREAAVQQGITWIQADLTTWTVEPTFDAVVASMVFLSIPDWTAALRTCVQALRPGGQLIFSVDHPCFESGAGGWKDSGVVEVTEYLAEYVMQRPVAPDTHRTLSTYLNAVIAAGCQIIEVVEPGLDPALVADGPPKAGILVHVPVFSSSLPPGREPPGSDVRRRLGRAAAAHGCEGATYPSIVSSTPSSGVDVSGQVPFQVARRAAR